MAMQNPDKDELQTNAFSNSGYLGIIAICDGLSTYSITIFFAYMAQNISYHIRSKVFKSILQMHMGWFDLKENISAKLCSILSEDASVVNGVIEHILGTYIQSFSGLILALIISFCFCWEMGLFALVILPIMICVYLFLANARKRVESSVAGEVTSSSIVSESVQNIRTVTSFANKDQILDLYNKNIHTPLMKIKRNALVNGIMLGALELLHFCSFAYCFYTCSYVIREYDKDPEDAFISFYIFFCAAYFSF